MMRRLSDSPDEVRCRWGAMYCYPTGVHDSGHSRQRHVHGTGHRCRILRILQTLLGGTALDCVMGVGVARALHLVACLFQ